MPHAKAQSRREAWPVAIAIAAVLATCLPASAREAVLADGSRFDDSALTSAAIDGSASATTLTVGGEPRNTNDLVRWGEPLPPASRPGIVLANGSRLLSDREWAPNGLVQVVEGEEAIRLRRGRGWVEFDRNAVRWLLLTPSAAGLDTEQLPEAAPAIEDVVFLSDGDQIAGQISKLSAGSLTVMVAGQRVETPSERVAAVRLADGNPEAASPACLVGLDDGSLLKANRLVVEGDEADVTLADVTVALPADEVAFVQPIGDRVRYLSDLEPVDYRHTPYLDLAWPYARDRGLRGGPLAGGGRWAAKGLAMHSAARLVYRLDGSSQRFQAELAVADPEPLSAATGSVSFRVYLVKDGGFQPAYEGPTQRVGDPAVPIDVDVTGAAAIALVIDYADNGDSGDDALWLDARLVPDPQGG